MTRVAVRGSAFAGAVEVLGLDEVDDKPDVVLVDLRDDAAVAAAAALPAEIPRVAVVSEPQVALLRALGSRASSFSLSSEPAAIGPLIRAAAPVMARRASRTFVVTSAEGGAGRTLLAVNVASRLAAHGSILVIDLTGTGSAAWWLGASVAPWSDLEGLVDELTSDHLAVVAAEIGGVRLVGGPAVMPSLALTAAVLRAATSLADIVIVDAPHLADERTRTAIEAADRVVVVATERPTQVALPDDDSAWIVASRSRSERIGGRAVLRALPDDPASVRAAIRDRTAVGGALGRAYDDLAELVAIDAS